MIGGIPGNNQSGKCLQSCHQLWELHRSHFDQFLTAIISSLRNVSKYESWLSDKRKLVSISILSTVKLTLGRNATRRSYDMCCGCKRQHHLLADCSLFSIVSPVKLTLGSSATRWSPTICSAGVSDSVTYWRDAVHLHVYGQTYPMKSRDSMQSHDMLRECKRQRRLLAGCSPFSVSTVKLTLGSRATR